MFELYPSATSKAKAGQHGGFRAGYHAPGNAAQEVMGWDNCHLYRFEIGSRRYGLI